MKFLRTLAIAALCIFMLGCTDSDLRKANRAGKQIADDLHEFESQVEAECAIQSGHCTGSISDDEAKNLATIASQATLADDTFISKVKTLSTIDDSNRAQVAAWLQDVVVQIQALNDQGVLHVKNPQTRDKLSLIFQSINAGLAVIQAIVTPAQSSDKPSPSIPVKQAGFTAAEVTLLLAAFEGIAKLIVQARADGTLTDEQLQAAATAENADTRTHAQAFIAQLEGKTPPQP